MERARKAALHGDSKRRKEQRREQRELKRRIREAKEAEARWEEELEKWYDSGEVLGSGSAELQSRFLWL